MVYDNMTPDDIVKMLVEKGVKPSSITEPVSGTLVYVAKAIEHMIQQLQNVADCYVLCENGIEIPDSMRGNNTFYIVDNVTSVFAAYSNACYERTVQKNRSRSYTTENGSTIGENVILGQNVVIEQGVFIDHDVVIGDHSVVRRNACVQSNSVIGNHCYIGENTIIGNKPFNYYTCDHHLLRMPPLGSVIVMDYGEICANCIVDCGTIVSTVIGYNTKIDAFVHVGHDVKIGHNVLITTSSVIGAFTKIGDGTKVYTSQVMKRLAIGCGCTLCFGCVVHRDISDHMMVIGNPARCLPNKPDA